MSKLRVTQDQLNQLMQPKRNYVRKTYVRKTEDEWQLHQYTGRQYGWEEVTAATSRKEIKELQKNYRENQPQYPTKIVCKRVKIQEGPTL